ncbi:unnamed protein product [Rhizopus stolonifer]
MLSKDPIPTCTISTTPKNKPIMIPQSSPGLSFFCQPIYNNNNNKKTVQPRVVSRINLPIQPKELILRDEISQVNEKKIRDLEQRKQNLLDLNQALENALYEQRNTIIDLERRLTKPSTPIPELSKEITSYSEFEKLKEDEEAAFERIKLALSHLVQQAQSTISTDTVNKKAKIVKPPPNQQVKTRPPLYTVKSRTLRAR